MSNDLLAILRSKTRLRQLLKPMHPEDLQHVMVRVGYVLEEKRQALSAIEEKKQQRQGQVDEIRTLMDEQGLTLKDLGGSGRKTRKPRQPTTRYTFQYQSADGKTQCWEGSKMGRLPLDFKAYLERTGKKRMECVIES